MRWSVHILMYMYDFSKIVAASESRGANSTGTEFLFIEIVFPNRKMLFGVIMPVNGLILLSSTTRIFWSTSSPPLFLNSLKNMLLFKLLKLVRRVSPGLQIRCSIPSLNVTWLTDTGKAVVRKQVTTLSECSVIELLWRYVRQNPNTVSLDSMQLRLWRNLRKSAKVLPVPKKLPVKDMLRVSSDYEIVLKHQIMKHINAL